jgi:predicted nucleic acid-binding protein
MSSGSNVLIALIDPAHVAHDDAHRWFEITGHAQWATCTIIENGVIRIAGNIKYPNSPGSPAIVLDMVRILKALPGHQFWPDDISLATAEIDPAKIQTPGQVTDSYLLVSWRPSTANYPPPRSKAEKPHCT